MDHTNSVKHRFFLIFSNFGVPECDPGFCDGGGRGSSQFWRGSEVLSRLETRNRMGKITYSQCEMPIVPVRLFHILLYLRREWRPTP